MEIGEKKLREIFEEYDQKADQRVDTLKEGFERQVGGFKEDIDHKLDAVLEILPDMQKKVDATFDKVGEIAIDVEVIKEVVKDHEVRIQKLEAR